MFGGSSDLSKLLDMLDSSVLTFVCFCLFGILVSSSDGTDIAVELSFAFYEIRVCRIAVVLRLGVDLTLIDSA